MRSKMALLLLSGIMALSILLSPTSVSAANTEMLMEGEITHVHTSSDGSCYKTVTVHTHGSGCYHYCSGNSSSGGGCYGSANYHSHATSCNIYHSHSGSSSSGGGCYGTAVKCTKSEKKVSRATGQYCSGCGSYGLYVYDVYETHSACGASDYSKGSYSEHPDCGYYSSSGTTSVATTTHTYKYSRDCGMTTSTVIGYSCGKTTSTVESYSKNCGRSNGQLTCSQATTRRDLDCSNADTIIGIYQIIKERHGAVYKLSATINSVSVNGSDFLTGSSLTWNTGDTGILNVTANATYTLTISYNDRGVTKTKNIPFTITDYDDISPTIDSVTENPIFRITDSTGKIWYGTELKLTINASDNFSGVTQYSLGGNEWQTLNILTIDKNGTYNVYAKDAIGNVSLAYVYTVNDFDEVAPTVSITDKPTAWTNQPITVTYTATDNVDTSVLSYFVSKTAGLTAISGNANTSVQIEENGTYYVYCKDSVGNVGSASFEVSNIDVTAPVITVASYSTALRNEPLDISFTATDDSNDTIYYAMSESPDLTWEQVRGSETTYTFIDNGIYYIYAADLAGNLAKLPIEIDFFDLTPPVITIEEYDTAYRKDPLEIHYPATDDSNCIIKYAFATVENLPVSQITENEPKHTITDNGIYYIYAVDSVGNITKERIEIAFFDKEAPTFTYTINTPIFYPDTNGKRWTLQNDIFILATDNIAMHETSYRFADNFFFIAEDSFSYTTNGIFTITVRDSVGNEATQNVTVDNIDEYNPVIENIKIFYENEDDTEVSVVSPSSLPPTYYIRFGAECYDEESGMPNNYLRVKYENEEFGDWTAKSELYYLNGTYTIEVRDNCENTITRTVTITNLKEVFPVEIVDIDNNGNILNSTTVEKPLGSTVAGSILGTITNLDTYYKDYCYTSCSTCVVEPLGNIAYRYFKKPSHTVKFFTDTGLTLSSVQVLHNEAIKYIPTAYKEDTQDLEYIYHYEFIEWVDINGKTVNLNNITSNLTLFPRFEETSEDRYYTVTFYSDNGDVISRQSVKAGQSPIVPTVPERYGCAFTSWNKPITVIYSDADITAQYTWILEEIPEDAVIMDTGQDMVVEVPDYGYKDIITDDIGSNDIEYIDPTIALMNTTDKTDSPDNFQLENALLDLTERFSKQTLEDTLNEVYEEGKDIAIKVTTTVAPPVVGVSAAYAIATVVTHLFTGAGVAQLTSFAYALIFKKVRYMQGAWLTASDGVKYVDSLGRVVECVWNEKTGQWEFFRKSKKLDGVDVDELLKKLNSGEIAYEEFEKALSKSKVYTSFSKDLEIEVQNVKLSGGISKKAKGLSLSKNISKMMDVAGNYKVQLTNKGKSIVFEMKYAMKQV